jgi:type IV secretion system protein VirB10
MVGWIGDFGQAIANKTASSGSQLSFSQTTNSGSDAASKALDATINIAPSLVKNQGAHLKIYVARDLDFRKVYGIANNS